LLNVEADAQVNVDLFDNRIANNAGFGIHTTESINAQADTRHVDGEWHGNEIVNNGLAGIQLDSAVDDLSIGVPGIGNNISNNGGGGIVVNGPGTGQITDNTINNNGGTGIDLNITSSSVNQLNVWAISLNAIVGNAGDGIEILNNQAQFDPFTPGLQVTLTDNNIRRNAGRGIDILNRVGSAGRTDLSISAAGNSIIENGLEGVYLVNTASTSQNQTAPATAAAFPPPPPAPFVGPFLHSSTARLKASCSAASSISPSPAADPSSFPSFANTPKSLASSTLLACATCTSMNTPISQSRFQLLSTQRRIVQVCAMLLKRSWSTAKS
jgi:hypothetical protein